jgi:hypothetical protein
LFLEVTGRDYILLMFVPQGKDMGFMGWLFTETHLNRGVLVTL